jgi:hypothetical protein
MHDAITIGVPVFAIFLGILMNQRGLERLEGRMERLEGRMERIQSDVNGRMDRMQADLSRFYQILGEHGGKIELLSKKS